jgi:hypothetical protein
VHLGLGLGQQLEHRERIIGHGRWELASPDQPADLAETAVLLMVFLAPRSMCRVRVGASLLANPFGLAIMVMMMIVPMVLMVMMIVPMVLMVMMIVSMVMVVMMIVSMLMVVMMIVPMVMAVIVMMVLEVVHRAAAGGIEDVELGPRDAPAGHLSRSELHPLHPEGGHVAPDLVQARSKVDEGAHEHIAAHPCRRVEVEDALHLELSFRPPAASLLIMSAW